MGCWSRPTPFVSSIMRHMSVSPWTWDFTEASNTYRRTLFCIWFTWMGAYATLQWLKSAKSQKNDQKSPMDFVELSQWQDTISDLKKQGAKWKPEKFVTLAIFQFFENINFSSAYTDVFRGQNKYTIVNRTLFNKDIYIYIYIHIYIYIYIMIFVSLRYCWKGLVLWLLWLV